MNDIYMSFSDFCKHKLLLEFQVTIRITSKASIILIWQHNPFVVSFITCQIVGKIAQESDKKLTNLHWKNIYPSHIVIVDHFFCYYRSSISNKVSLLVFPSSVFLVWRAPIVSDISFSLYFINLVRIKIIFMF